MENAEKIQIKVPVHIPTEDGKEIAETIHVEVEAWRNIHDGEVYLGDATLEYLDKVKARYMGVLLPAEIAELRRRFKMTQAEMSEMLKIGMKTYSRWENGRERPSQSSNLLLKLLSEGKLSPYDLYATHNSQPAWSDVIVPHSRASTKPRLILGQNEATDANHEALSVAA